MIIDKFVFWVNLLFERKNVNFLDLIVIFGMGNIVENFL